MRRFRLAVLGLCNYENVLTILGRRQHTGIASAECLICVNDGVQLVGLFHFMRSLYDLK